MESLRQYMLSVVSAAMILGILKGISGQSKLLKLVGGLFLTFVILQPLARFDFADLTDYFGGFSETGSMIAAGGGMEAEEVRRSIIKQQVEAYILDKAESLEVELQVSVELGPEEMPAAVRLQGRVPSDVKNRLMQIMESDLGIAKENQLWVG